jgi:hypothetical protein
MQRMPKPGVYRSPWQGFPDVVIQTTVAKLRSRPAYDQAKGGVGEAAFEVVRELVKPKKIPFVFDTVVPVMQFDRDKPNALPLVYAAALAKHFEAYLETGVRQVNVVSHTFADAQTRILGQPIFMGKIQTRSQVLIVDDVVTYGSTLANLRGWLEKQGATVVGATTLAAGFGGTKLALPDIVRYQGAGSLPAPGRGPRERAGLFCRLFYESGSPLSARAKKRTRNATSHCCRPGINSP